ncbi:MAG: glycosyl transferase [Methylococcales bacterium]
MGDFYQHKITTLHKLVDRPIEEIEAELTRFSKTRPMSLVLPSLYSELSGPALSGILDELTQVPYLEEIVIGLDRADQAEFGHAQEYFGRLSQRHRILWNDGPRLRALDDELIEKGLSPKESGKGRNVWFCYGYVLASARSDAIALHDCDIVTYKKELLARLFYPIANPSFSYEFCKGFYFRAAEGRLNGRVSRLLVTPLIRALKQILGNLDYLDYLDSFRYPLAGEFAMRVDVVKELRIPSDWGLEIGLLSEVYRNLSSKALCQVEIADAYDHKHQSLSVEDPQTGLSKMSVDIAKAIYRKLAIQGVVLTKETFRTIKAVYYRNALDFVDMYYADGLINGIHLDRHEEEQAVELFAKNIILAGDVYLDNPQETPFIPCWNRVTAAIPDFLDRLYEAVELDNG